MDPGLGVRVIVALQFRAFHRIAGGDGGDYGSLIAGS